MPGAVPPNLGLKKAKLKVVEGGSGSLEFQFNPTKYTITRSASWRHAPSASGISETAAQYVGEANPSELKIDDILFDAYEELMGNVSEPIQKLLDWTRPTQQSIDANAPQPPILQFEYGGNPVLNDFKGYLESVSATYTMFNKGGKPIRAKVSLSLKSTKKISQAAQNPSSGALESRRVRVLVEGDTLHSVAYAEYGVPRYWRGLAAFNHIEDPLRVKPGMHVLIPNADEAAELS